MHAGSWRTIARRAVLAALLTAEITPACDGSSRSNDAQSLSLATLNIASGAGDRFRTSEHRVVQGAFLARTGALAIALQEVDVGTDRSGNADSAASVAAAIDAGFRTCRYEVDAAPHVRAEGTILQRCDAGAIVFGTAFRADDPFNLDMSGMPSGIMDVDGSLNPPGVDRSDDAYYGNALVVRHPWEVTATFTVALPNAPEEPFVSAELLAVLRDRPPNEEAIAALATHNLGVRRARSIEPRSLLVARVRHPSGTSLTILTTHLESAGSPELRSAQLDAALVIAKNERASAGAPRIVMMGDFNMPGTASTEAMKAASFTQALGAPSDASAIDQIWVDGALTIETALLVPTEGASDHRTTATATIR